MATTRRITFALLGSVVLMFVGPGALAIDINSKFNDKEVYTQGDSSTHEGTLQDPLDSGTPSTPSAGQTTAPAMPTAPKDPPKASPYEYRDLAGCQNPNRTADDSSCESSNNSRFAKANECTANGKSGTRSIVYQRLKNSNDTWQPFSEYCALDNPDQKTKPTTRGETAAQFAARLHAEVQKAFMSSPVNPGITGAENLNPANGPYKAVVGMHTNFYATPKPQRFTHNLLGQRIDITATPVLYYFDYGDGTSYGYTQEPGTPMSESEWQAVDEGKQQVTQNGHTFTHPGAYPVRVYVAFTGSYTVNGTGTRPIQGRLNLSTKPLTVNAKALSIDITK